jgi:hypothetical protein
MAARVSPDSSGSRLAILSVIAVRTFSLSVSSMIWDSTSLAMAVRSVAVSVPRTLRTSWLAASATPDAAVMLVGVAKSSVSRTRTTNDRTAAFAATPPTVAEITTLYDFPASNPLAAVQAIGTR